MNENLYSITWVFFPKVRSFEVQKVFFYHLFIFLKAFLAIFPMYSTYFSHIKQRSRVWENVSYFLFLLSLGNAENFWISNDVSTLLRRIFVRLRRNRLRRSSIHRYRKLDSFQTYVILCAISIFQYL